MFAFVALAVSCCVIGMKLCQLEINILITACNFIVKGNIFVAQKTRHYVVVNRNIRPFVLKYFVQQTANTCFVFNTSIKCCINIYRRYIIKFAPEREQFWQNLFLCTDCIKASYKKQRHKNQNNYRRQEYSEKYAKINVFGV